VQLDQPPHQGQPELLGELQAQRARLSPRERPGAGPPGAEAERRKDELLALLVHELRSPLSPLRNALHILKQLGGDDPMAERVRGLMERQVQQLARLVDNLLDLSRISQGQLEFRPEVVDLAALVRRTAEAGRRLARDRHLELTVSLPGEAVRVRGDPARLEQVVGHLLDNAIRYTDPGGHIALTVGPEGGEAVVRWLKSFSGGSFCLAPPPLPRPGLTGIY
jgi:signal transduction histidine kinase